MSNYISNGVMIDVSPERDTENDSIGTCVHQHEGKWYFWDECGIDRMGPWDTEVECHRQLDSYCRDYLGMQ